MKKPAIALASVAVFALVGFGGSAGAAPARIAPSISASHDAVATVARKAPKKKAAPKKTASRKTSKSKKKAA